MQTLTIFDNSANSLQIHSSTTDVGYFLKVPIQGFEMPQVENSVIRRAGEHGVYIPSNFWGSRSISLEGKLFGTSTADYESKRRNLEKILRLERDSNGIALPKTLKFTTADSLNLQIEAFLRSPLKMNIHELSHADFLIDMVADYLIVAQAATTQNFSITSGGGGFVLPAILPIVFGSSSSQSATKTNNGNGEAWPTVTFTGPLTNPRLLNSTTGKSMALTYNVPSGASVIIDMREKTIIENGTTNRIDKKTSVSEWWWLDPGDNDFYFSTSDSSDAGSCTLSFRDSYIGI